MSMMSSYEKAKSSLLFALAFTLIAFAGWALVHAQNDFKLRSAAMLGLLGSVYLVRRSKTSGRAVQRTQPLHPWIWLAGFALLGLTAFSFYTLYRDALEGYTAVWPVYFFAGAAMTATVFWSFIITRIVSA